MLLPCGMMAASCKEKRKEQLFLQERMSYNDKTCDEMYMTIAVLDCIWLRQSLLFKLASLIH